MHILYLLPEYPPASCGGIGTLYSRLIPWIASQGVKVTIITLDAGLVSRISECKGNVEIRRIPTSQGRWADLQNAWNIAREAKSLLDGISCPDLIEASDWGNLLLFVPAGIPRICRIEGSVGFFRRVLGQRIPRFSWLIEKLTFIFRCDYFISCSHYAWDVTRKIYGLDGRLNHVINNIVEVKTFIPAPDLRRPDSILYAGSLSRKKGVVELCLAFNKVAEQHPVTKLVFVGRAGFDAESNLPMQEFLTRLLSPGALERVTFVGEVPPELMPSYMQRAEIFAFASKAETFGNVWVEAMACGCLVIGSTYGPFLEIMGDEKSALTADPASPVDIADQILYALALAPARKEEIRLLARQRVIQKFSIENLGPQNLNFYEKFLK